MATNGMANRNDIYKGLGDLSVKTKDTLVIVENGKPQSVVVPYEEYKQLKSGTKRKSKMKGMILAGGHATRLRPLTWVTNKHLLPIFDRPMIYYPLESMKRAGVKDVLLVTNPEHAGHFMNLLGTGEEFGLHLEYKIQKKPGGLAEAVSLAEGFSDGNPLLVVLGDNIFDYDLTPAIERFLEQGSGARVFAKYHPNPNQYGVVEVNPEGKVVSIEEKPKSPRSNYAQIGVYMYSPDVFDHIRTLTPSARGELEITDLNNLYLNSGDIYAEIWGDDIWWIDAGESHLTLFQANVAAAERSIEKEKEKKLGSDKIEHSSHPEASV